MLRFVDGNALIPLAYVHHTNPMGKRRTVNSYAPEGREQIRRSLGVNAAVLKLLMEHPAKGQSIEHNDNRFSLYCGQLGKCAVTGEELSFRDIHCHHKTPKSKGGCKW